MTSRRQAKKDQRDGDNDTLKRGARREEQKAQTGRTAEDRQWAAIAAGEYRAELARRLSR